MGFSPEESPLEQAVPEKKYHGVVWGAVFEISITEWIEPPPGERITITPGRTFLVRSLCEQRMNIKL